MRLLMNNGRVAAIGSVALAIMIWAACGSASAAPPDPIPSGQQSAPVGHRQPNASNVPESVLRDEKAMEAEDSKLDKELNICRGC
jgi:hypothetical protein